MNAVTKATAALKESIGLILASDGSEEEKRQELVETFTQFQTYLDRNVVGSEERRNKFLEIFRVGKADARDDDDGGDRNTGGDSGGASNHALSHLADLAVESQKFSSRAEALNWLISHPNGHAFARLHLHKAAETAKEQPMTLENILKDYGAAKICKHIVAEGKTGYSEFDLVDALTKHAAAQFNMPGDRAFAKLYESEESVRRACNIAKAAAPVFDPQVQVVGGTDVNPDDPSAALEALHRIGRERWPEASEAIRFTRAFDANPELARKAHVRPTPPANGAYPYPR
jgi:hypothetical protein